MGGPAGSYGVHPGTLTASWWLWCPSGVTHCQLVAMVSLLGHSLPAGSYGVPPGTLTASW